jgi:hypothetical protein
MRKGAAERIRDPPHVSIDSMSAAGGGGSWSGEAAVKGMNDAKLGNIRELDIKCNCWRMANMRNVKVT